MESPERTTITLEAEHLADMKRRYGRNWQEIVRQLIAAHLSGLVLMAHVAKKGIKKWKVK